MLIRWHSNERQRATSHNIAFQLSPMRKHCPSEFVNSLVFQLIAALKVFQLIAALKKNRIFVLATLLSTAAIPALAGLDRVGTVKFPMRQNHESIRAKFTADTVALTARDGDVFCRNVEARFANNRTRMILHNVSLTFDQTVKVHFQGVRNVKRLDFDCWSVYSWRTQVDIAANTT